MVDGVLPLARLRAGGHDDAGAGNDADRLGRDVALGLAQASGGLEWFGGRMDLGYQMWRLSPGVAPELGLDRKSGV